MTLCIGLFCALACAAPLPPADVRAQRATQSGASTYLVGGLEGTISTDGRWVAFKSGSLQYYQTYVLDRTAPTTTQVRMSVRTDPGTACGPSSTKGIAISGDGRHVAFVADGSLAADVSSCSKYHGYVHDRDADGNGIYDEDGGTRTLRVSDPAQCSDVVDMAISGNGRIVTYGCFGSGGLYITDRDADADGVYDEEGEVAYSPVVAGSSWSPNPVDASGDLALFRASGLGVDNLFCQGTYGLVDCPDIFLFERRSGHYEAVSTADGGHQLGDGEGRYPALSPDGRYVGFVSGAGNLVDGDLNVHNWDAFLKDRLLGTTTRLSAGVNGTGDAATTRDASGPAISEGGRYVAFSSGSPNLVVPPDTYGSDDVFLYDTESGATTRLSADGGDEAHAVSPHISGDGRYVVYRQWGDGLYLYDQGTVSPGIEYAIYDPAQEYTFDAYTFHTRVVLEPNAVASPCSRIITQAPTGLSACLETAPGGTFGGLYNCLEITGDIPAEWTACIAPSAVAPSVAPGASTGTSLTLEKPMRLSVTYLEQDLTAPEETLALHYWANGEWVPEPSSVVDVAHNKLSATTTRWAVWRILGEGEASQQLFLPLAVRR